MKQLQGLLAFIEVADAGSLAEASRRLDVTPAAVSKSLLKLEAELGVRLMQRNTRTLRLTPEGERFLEKARMAVRVLNEAVADVSQSATTASGRVRISVGTAFGRNWVLPALPAIAKAHPQLGIEVDLDNHAVDLVAAGYDIGIRGGVIENSSLVARRISPLPLVLVASPAYLKRAGVPQSPADLAAHSSVQMHFSDGSLSTWRFRAVGRRPGAVVQPQASILVNDSEAVVHVALADGGIAQVGLYHALPYLRSGRLKLVLGALHDASAREFVLHYPHRLYLAPRVRVVVDALLTHFKAASDLHLQPADLPAQFHAAVSDKATSQKVAAQKISSSKIQK
jgi:DNA-binding transcriptional LysR family regulator